MDKNFFSTLETPVDFIIIRHGQSEGNHGKILQGRGEYPLTDQGRNQAAERGDSLKPMLSSIDTSPVLFFSSPQGRALETAEIIAAGAGLPAPVPSDTLVEMDLGIWSGKNWDEAQREDPLLWAQFRARSWEAIPGAESPAALYRRAMEAWELFRDEAKRQSARTVIAVSHGGLIQWLLRTTFGNRTWFPLFPISNCGLFKLRVEPNAKNNSAYMAWETINEKL
jgi:broad specificity phosphatase PhoE